MACTAVFITMFPVSSRDSMACTAVFITMFPRSSRKRLHVMHCSFHNNVPRKLKGETPWHALQFSKQCSQEAQGKDSMACTAVFTNNVPRKLKGMTPWHALQFS